MSFRYYYYCYSRPAEKSLFYIVVRPKKRNKNLIKNFQRYNKSIAFVMHIIFIYGRARYIIIVFVERTHCAHRKLS